MQTTTKTKLVQGGALAVSLSAGIAIGNVTAGSDPAPARIEAPVARRVDKRLDVTTDVEVSPGAMITAQGKVEIGTRLVPIVGCVGRYDSVTQICVLSPGLWELHSACYERSGVDASSVCEISVRNTGGVPLKFSGYVEVAASRVEDEGSAK